MTFRTLLLTAALALPALGAASAQDAAPVAVPALPPSNPAPSDPAPATPEVQPTPEAPAEPPAAPVLLLTAAPGTYAEYAQTTQTSVKLLTYRLEAQPGKTVRAADLAAANQKLQAQRAQLEQAFSKSINNQMSKLYLKVLPPKNGNTVLLYTTVLNLPDPLTPKKQNTANIGLTLTYSPAGQVIDASIATKDPTLQKFYQALDLSTLIKSAESSGTTSYFGLPLVQGEPTVTTSTVPMQGFVQGLASLIAGSASTAGGAAASSAQASPLTLQSTTSYTGTDAQGNLLFSQKYSAEPWNVSLKAGDLKLDMKVLGLTGTASSVVRPDGFPRSSQMQQDMNVQMQVNIPGDPYRLVVQLQYGTRMSVTPKP